MIVIPEHNNTAMVLKLTPTS